jgi:hypothetical protein
MQNFSKMTTSKQNHFVLASGWAHYGCDSWRKFASTGGVKYLRLKMLPLLPNKASEIQKFRALSSGQNGCWWGQDLGIGPCAHLWKFSRAQQDFGSFQQFLASRLRGDGTRDFSCTSQVKNFFSVRLQLYSLTYPCILLLESRVWILYGKLKHKLGV